MELEQQIVGHATNRLCDQCRYISLAAIQSRYLLHPNFQSLVDSSVSCGMCELVRHCLRNVIKQYIRLDGRASEHGVTLMPHEAPGKVWVHALRLKLGELWLYAQPDPIAAKSPSLQLPAAFIDVEEITLPLLAGILEDCVHGCGQCCMSDAGQIPLPPLLPRRVLDLSVSADDGTLSVRLHESKPGERSFYVTLSHRWGEAIPSKTTKANISVYKQGINYNKLPDTFKDAITITRKMGFWYLWIDALCIIQDDLYDWESQAPLMGAIFQDATCTIAAHSAKDSSCGFLSAKKGSGMVEIQSRGSTRWNSSCKMYLGLPRSFDEVVLTSHIVQRGWIQQELILSRRLLHFSRGLVYWECPHTKQPKPLGFTAGHAYLAWGMNRTTRFEEDMEGSWIEFVEHYSTCKLTFEKDRLVAIDGIARVWMDRLGKKAVSKYRYGHFVHNPRSLLWAATCEVDCKKKDVPSWSWASTEATVQFIRCRPGTAEHENQPFHMPSIRSAIKTPTLDAAILSVNKSSVRGTCALVVQAQTRTLELYRGEQGPFLSWWRMWPGNSPTGFHLQNIYGTVWFDHYPEEKPPEPNDKVTKKSSPPLIQVQCVRICTFEHTLYDDDDGGGGGGVVRAFGVLLLQPGNAEKSFFKRVGVGLIAETGWFTDSTPIQTLHIQ